MSNQETVTTILIERIAEDTITRIEEHCSGNERGVITILPKLIQELQKQLQELEEDMAGKTEWHRIKDPQHEFSNWFDRNRDRWAQ